MKKNAFGYLLKKGEAGLRRHRIASAALDAEVLLSFVAKKPKEFIFAEPNFAPKKILIAKFNQLIKRRAAGEPVAYLVGQKEFFGLDFLVNKSVLIPRPETELLAETAIDFLKTKAGGRGAIVEIGTGSGCLSIAIKKNLPAAEITAIDISVRALDIAKKNAARHGAKIKFLRGDLLAPLGRAKPDIIIANLPYLTSEEIAANRELRFEPRRALLAGKNPIGIFEKLFRQYKKTDFACPIFLEINPQFATPLKRLATDFFPGRKAEVKKDLNGRERFLFVI